ncbi:MAG: hypothetical protein ACPLX8_01035, partial [Nanopusillaceae archaeon]
MDNEEKKYPKELFNRPISTSTSPHVVNQLQQYLEKTWQGYPGVEIQTFQFSGQWETIPKIIFEEIARNARINNIDLSIHAPERDFQIAGLFVGNFGYSQIDREVRNDARYKISSVLETAEYISSIYGKPVKVNMHAGDMEITKWDKETEEQIKNMLKNDQNYRREFLTKLYRMGYIDSNTYNQLINKGNLTDEDLNKIPSWAFAKSELFFIEGLFGRDIRRVGGYSEADPRNKKSVVDDLYKKNEEIITEILSRIYNEYNSLTSGVNNIANVLFYYAAGNNKKLGELLNNINSYSIFLDRLSEIINSIEGSLDNIEDNNFKRNILNELENKKRIIQNLKRQIENYKENLHNFIENVYQNRYVGGDMMKFGMDFYNNLLFL